MAVMKIQLEDQDILNLLNKQGPEIAIEIKNFIIQEFVRKHLKSLLNTQIVKDAEKIVLQGAEQAAAEYFGKANWHSTALTDKARGLITEAVQAQFLEIVRDSIDRTMAGYATRLDEIISKSIENRMNSVVNNLVETRFRKALEAANATSTDTTTTQP